MTTTIYKYALDSCAFQSTIQMPKETKILHVDSQHDDICLWAEVDPTVELEDRIFKIFGIGWEIPARNRKYLGTAKISDDRFIFHVYEKL